MSKVFALRKDAPQYKQLDLNISDVARHAPDDADFNNIYYFYEHNSILSDWWKTPDTNFIGYEGEISSKLPDISVWIGATLVLSPRAYRLLGELLKKSGELLPVTVLDETYYIFNCYIFGKENKKTSRFNEVDGMQMGLEYLEFNSDIFEFDLFKSKMDKGLTLFCNEKFKDIVDNFQLDGIIFDENLIPSDRF